MPTKIDLNEPWMREFQTLVEQANRKLDRIANGDKTASEHDRLTCVALFNAHEALHTALAERNRYVMVIEWLFERISVDDFGDVRCDDDLLEPKEAGIDIEATVSFQNIIDDIRAIGVNQETNDGQ